MPTISETLKTFGQIKKLSDLMNPENGDGRWGMLQDWLADHPEYQAVIHRCLDLSPQDALETICAHFDIDLDPIRVFDAKGQIEGMAVRTIEIIQTLYRERAAADQASKPQTTKRFTTKRKRSKTTTL